MKTNALIAELRAHNVLMLLEMACMSLTWPLLSGQDALIVDALSTATMSASGCARRAPASNCMPAPLQCWRLCAALFGLVPALS